MRIGALKRTLLINMYVCMYVLCYVVHRILASYKVYKNVKKISKKFKICFKGGIAKVEQVLTSKQYFDVMTKHCL